MPIQDTKQIREPATPVQSVDRAIDILYCLGSAPAPLTLTEISRRTELDKATAHRLLRTLVARDLVARSEPTGRYLPGPGVLRLGGGASSGLDLRTIARPYMDRLAALSQETVGLGMLADGQHIYIAQSESPHELRWVVRIGVPVPLHIGAGPRALLAFLPEREREGIIARLSFSDIGPAGPQNADQLREVLAEIRRTAVSLNAGERTGHGMAIAVPLLGRSGRPLGTLVVGGADERVTKAVVDGLREPLLAAGRELSHQLGYGGTLP